MSAADPVVAAFEADLSGLERQTLRGRLVAGSYEGWKLRAAQKEIASRDRRQVDDHVGRARDENAQMARMRHRRWCGGGSDSRARRSDLTHSLVLCSAMEASPCPIRMP